jgi:hypothetical protein
MRLPKQFLKNKKNVLLITRELYPFATAGIAFHVFYTSKILSEKFNIHILHDSSRPLSLIFIPLGLIRFTTKIKKADLIHAHQALAPAILAYLISKLYRIPFIVTCHGSDIRNQKNKLVWLIQSFILRRANYVTVVSEELKKILVHNYSVDPSRISIIRNGYDEKEINQLRRETKVENSKKIVFVGSLRPIKDPYTLLLGFFKIKTKYPDVKLHIIGDGPLREELKKVCMENDLYSSVIFEGRKTHRETLRSIAESTIFIMTSIGEGLPTVLIEAMALGKPVIATAVGGIPEVVKHEINGLLIPPRCPECVAQALDKLLSNPDLRKKYRKAAEESVKDLSWRKISEQYAEIYIKLFSKLKFRNQG